MDTIFKKDQDITILGTGLKMNPGLLKEMDAIVQDRRLTRADIVREAIVEYVEAHTEARK